MAAWLPQPVMFQSPRDFDCDGFDPDQCTYYKERWHNWYVADLTFALPTVAFFMCAIGIFIIGHTLTNILSWSHRPEPLFWRRIVAAVRYMSYRGFNIKILGWYSAPIGVLFLGAIGAIYFFCMDLAPFPYYWPGTDIVWGNSPPLGTRSGWLALGCMPFLFATASKANWITLVTGITHEKLQVFHRWIAYAFFILALMHTFPFVVWHIRNHDMVTQFTVDNVFEYWTGVVALLFQTWLTFASCGPIRNLSYEFFKVAHFLSAVVFMLVFFWHCDGTLTSWHYFVATAAIYVPCWTYPWLRTFFEYGVGQKAQVFVENTGFIRVTMPVNSTWQPGQHCFLRFRSFAIHALSSHPFTICSLPSDTPDRSSEMVFYIRRQEGFTSRLFNYAITKPGVLTPVLVDGPYGGIDNLKYFQSDRLIVVAGGSGAGWALPLVEQFLRYSTSTKSEEHQGAQVQENERDSGRSQPSQTPHRPRSMRVILVTRDITTRTWFHTTMSSLLLDHKSSGVATNLGVEVYLTGEAECSVQTSITSASDFAKPEPSLSDEVVGKTSARRPKELNTNDTLDEDIRGRPELPLVIRHEATAASTAGQMVGVFLCGPLTMQEDVRNAVAKENLNILKSSKPGGMYLHLEHFSWA